MILNCVPAIFRGAVIAACAATVLVGAMSPVAAQQSSGVALAFIDVQKILRESVAVKSLTTKIEAQRDKYQDELRQKEETLRNADQELARQRTILSAESYRQKRSDLEQEVAKLQQEVQERKRGLDRLFSQGMTQVQNELANVAKELADERGLDMILSKSTIVIAKPTYDLSNEALKRLNARLSTVELPAQQN